MNDWMVECMNGWEWGEGVHIWRFLFLSMIYGMGDFGWLVGGYE